MSSRSIVGVHSVRLGRRALALMLALLLVWPLVLPAQSFNRLFLTREERIQLDIARRDVGSEPVVVVPEQQRQAVVQPDPLVGQFTVNGIVIRSNGQNTSWINGSQVAAGTPTREGIRVQKRPGDASMRLMLPSGVDTIALRPGQKIDVATGKVFEVYEAEAGEGSKDVFEFSANDAAQIARGRRSGTSRDGRESDTGNTQDATASAEGSARENADENSPVFALRRLIELAIGSESKP